MTKENERKPGSSMNRVARGLAVAIMTLTAACLFPAAHAKDSPEDNTRVYQHTYDEIFQASLEAMERIGLYASATDKENGTISGTGGDCTSRNTAFTHTCDLKIHIEIVSSKPETRVTIIETKKHGHGDGWVPIERPFKQKFFGELQKVLATYR